MKKIFIRIIIILFNITIIYANTNRDLLEGAKAGNLEKVKDAIKKGANVNSIVPVTDPQYPQNPDEGSTALILASANGHIEIVKFLIKSGANVNKKCQYWGRTPLYEASYHGYVEIVRLLIKSGAEVSEGGNSLIFAPGKGHIEIVRILLNEGADINEIINFAEDSGSTTPLIFAVSVGHIKIVQLLLEAGADIAKSNNHNENALKIAQSKGHREIIKLLNEYNFKRNATVTEKNILVREKPSIIGKVILKLSKNDNVYIIQKTLDKQKIGKFESYWYKISLKDGKTGWCYGAWFKKN